MGALDVVWHVSNLFLPALALGALAAALAKLLWRRELAAASWLHLAGPASLANASVALAGLVLLGRDGKMLMYGSMVVACALTLWWQGFGPGRKKG